MATEHFGEHLMVDGYKGNFDKLNDGDRVLKCLNDLVERCEMHILNKPVVVEAPDNQIKDPGGFSAFVMIAESHISIHTFPARGFVSADVYTCKNGLDTEVICNCIVEAFLLQDIEVNLVERGKQYPAKNIYR